MKVTYEVSLPTTDEAEAPLYILRAADLLEGLAKLLRLEAQGGTVVSYEGCGVRNGGDSIICTAIHAAPETAGARHDCPVHGALGGAGLIPPERCICASTH